VFCAADIGVVALITSTAGLSRLWLLLRKTGAAGSVGDPGGRQDSSVGRTRTAARARLPGGRVLLARSVAGSAWLTRLASLLLHALARCIARGCRLTFNRALVLHTLPWRAILRRVLCRAHHGHREQQAASGCNRKNFIRHLLSLHWRLRGNSAITRCAVARFPGSKRARDGHRRQTNRSECAGNRPIRAERAYRRQRRARDGRATCQGRSSAPHKPNRCRGSGRVSTLRSRKCPRCCVSALVFSPQTEAAKIETRKLLLRVRCAHPHP
jgi:hypothetical protein